MREGFTYRAARREYAKMIARRDRLSFAGFWPESNMRLFPKGFASSHRPARGSTSEYAVHQGERECERRARAFHRD